MASRRPVRLVQSEVWLGRAEFEDMINQREPEAAPYPAAGTTTIEDRPLIGRSTRAAGVAPLFSPVAATAEDDGLIRIDDLEPADAETSNRPSPVKPRRYPRWAAAGVIGLVLVGGAASVPLLTSQSEPTRVAAKSTPPSSPETVISVSGPSDKAGDAAIEAESMAPVAASNRPAEESVRSEPVAAAAVAASRPAQHDNRPAAPPKRDASAPTPPQASQAALEEAFKWWSEAAKADAKNPRWTHFRPEPAPWHP
jgi:hypothetical protein